MKRSIRRGFTLAEVLVTVTITAVLAAVVVPSVVNQVKKGDKPSFTSEIQAVSTAVGQYATDTRSLPLNFGDLVDSTLVSTNTRLLWKGPYLTTGQDLSTTNSLYTGAAYGLEYANAFGATATDCTPANTYVPITVSKINGVDIASVPLTNSSFLQLWHDMDGGTGAATLAVAAGPVQYTVSGSNLATLHICMIAAAVN